MFLEVLAEGLSYESSMKENLILTVSSNELDLRQIQEVTLDLCSTINRETDITAILAEETAEPGSRADLSTVLGTVILPFLTGGGAVALINVLKSYVDRGTEINFKLERKDGKKLELTSKNLKQDQTDQLLSAINKFLGLSA
jgi:hypothetical protein